MATPTRGFRLTEAELARLARLSDALCTSETDAVRWGLVALEGLLRDGLLTGRNDDDDGFPEAFTLNDQIRSFYLTLRRNADGSFRLASESQRTAP